MQFAAGLFSLYNQFMSFTLDALEERPVALYQMDDTTPVQDYSGYNRTATISGTPAKHLSLAKGTAFSQVVDNSAVASFESPIFKQGYEDDSFSLEAWIRPVSRAVEAVTPQKVLSNSGQYDGITLEGTVIKFTTKYLTTGDSVCSYDLQIPRRAHVVGIHTETKNSLFVNGQLVSEVAVTDEQQTDTFTATSASLVSGTTTGSQGIALGPVGLYDRALNQDEITKHYLEGTDLPEIEQVTSLFQGDPIPMGLSNADVFIDQWWSTVEDWELGLFKNCSVANDRLTPLFDGDTSVTGQWLTSIGLEAAPSPVYGAVLNWDGEGVIVEVSIDNTTWETVSRGVKVTTIPAGFNPTDKELQVRITFPGGVIEDTAFVDNLNVAVLNNAVADTYAGRTVSYTIASPEREYPPLELNDNWGVEIASGGTVVVSADTLESTPARTIGLWIKRIGTNPTISASGTAYQNGAAGTTTLVTGQWTLLHIVAGADITGAITITGPAQLGAVEIYDTALTATDIANIYAAYTRTNAQRIGDTSVVAVSQTGDMASIYAHDWAIQGAG